MGVCVCVSPTAIPKFFTWSDVCIRYRETTVRSIHHLVEGKRCPVYLSPILGFNEMFAKILQDVCFRFLGMV